MDSVARGDDESTRERLLTAAGHRLRAGGLETVTTRAVAEDIGLTQSGVYRHFDNVDDLRAEAVGRVGSSWFDEIAVRRRRTRLAAGEARGGRGEIARSEYAEVLTRHLVDDSQIRRFIDHHRSAPNALGDRVRQLLDIAVDDLVEYLIDEVEHSRPQLAGALGPLTSSLRFHAALFIDDVLSVSRVADRFDADPDARSLTDLLDIRMASGWELLLADIDRISSRRTPDVGGSAAGG